MLAVRSRQRRAVATSSTKRVRRSLHCTKGISQRLCVRTSLRRSGKHARPALQEPLRRHRDVTGRAACATADIDR